jgi:hypothetical protein
MAPHGLYKITRGSRVTVRVYNDGRTFDMTAEEYLELGLRPPVEQLDEWLVDKGAKDA